MGVQTDRLKDKAVVFGADSADHCSLSLRKNFFVCRIRYPAPGPRPQLPPIGHAPAGGQVPAQYHAGVDQMYQTSPQLPPIGHAPAGGQVPAQYHAGVDQMYKNHGNLGGSSFAASSHQKREIFKINHLAEVNSSKATTSTCAT